MARKKKTKQKTKRRRLLHTSLRELRSIKSVAAALRIIDQYGTAAGDFLLEVCTVIAEIADRMPHDDWTQFTETCLLEQGALFRSSEHMKIMLAVGRGDLPENALKASLLRGVGAQYITILRTRQNKGQITKTVVHKAINEAVQQADPKPLADALGFKREKLPIRGKNRSNPKITGADLVRGVLVVDASTGLRCEIPDGIVDDLVRLRKQKNKKKKKGR